MKTAYNSLRDKLKSEGKSYAFTDAEEVYIAETMEAYASEVAQEFAEWMYEEGWIRDPAPLAGNEFIHWHKLHDDGIGLDDMEADGKTTAELYALYLTSTGQQSENKTGQK